MKQLITKLKEIINQLNKRERIIVGIVIAASLLIGIYAIGGEITVYLEEKDIEIEARVNDLKTISRTLQDYQVLKDRFEVIKKSFSAAQTSFEKAYGNLDNLVKKNVGAEGYDLKTKGDPSDMGLGYEKQDYTLKVNLNREQLVKLLFELEQGKSGLFLRQVRVSNKQGNLFEAQLDIYSIIKSKS